MLMQTNSYVVPKDRRNEHARLVARFRQTMLRLGCEHFEVYEQVGANWAAAEASGRFVQIMRFRDRRHQQQVQAAEQADADAQQLIREFCELVNLPYQQQHGLFAIGYYASVTTSGSPRLSPAAASGLADGVSDSSATVVPDAFSEVNPPTKAVRRREPTRPNPSTGNTDSSDQGQPGSLDVEDLVAEEISPPPPRES